MAAGESLLPSIQFPKANNAFSAILPCKRLLDRQRTPLEFWPTSYTMVPRLRLIRLVDEHCLDGPAFEQLRTSRINDYILFSVSLE